MRLFGPVYTQRVLRLTWKIVSIAKFQRASRIYSQICMTFFGSNVVVMLFFPVFQIAPTFSHFFMSKSSCGHKSGYSKTQ